MDLEDTRAAYSVGAIQSRPGRSRPSASPGAIADKPKRSAGHYKPRTATPDKRPLSDRIQTEREQLFKAISIVECCKYANATLLEVDTTEYLDGVFDALSDILNSTAGELGCIAEGCRKVS